MASSSLMWEKRSKAILDNIKNFEADFICLQASTIVFFDRNMEAHGYSGIPIENKEGYECAIFFKPKIAEFITYQTTRIQGYTKYENLCVAPSSSTVSSESSDVVNAEELSVVMAAFKILKPLIMSKRDRWDDLKLAKVKTLMTELASFKEIISALTNCSPSVILAGDFNSKPYVHKYINSDNIPSDIDLRSVYEFTKGEPRFTNNVPGFAETLDYMFYTHSEIISPVKLLDSPDEVDFLPNEIHPSDHLPIGVEFEINRNI
ncbi:putative poly(A)-specific ribonuclease [Arabidopsis thaliana]